MIDYYVINHRLRPTDAGFFFAYPHSYFYILINFLFNPPGDMPRAEARRQSDWRDLRANPAQRRFVRSMKPVRFVAAWARLCEARFACILTEARRSESLKEGLGYLLQLSKFAFARCDGGRNKDAGYKQRQSIQNAVGRHTTAAR